VKTRKMKGNQFFDCLRTYRKIIIVFLPDSDHQILVVVVGGCGKRCSVVRGLGAEEGGTVGFRC
jgi:hypothetical protein